MHAAAAIGVGDDPSLNMGNNASSSESAAAATRTPALTSRPPPRGSRKSSLADKLRREFSSGGREKSRGDSAGSEANENTRISGRVTIGRTLGRGKFGVVKVGHLVSDPGVRVAVKYIARTAGNEDTLDKEIRILESVGRHPAIVELYDVLATRTQVLMVMEYCDGGELFDRLIDAGPYTEKDAQQHIRTIVDALSFLHDDCSPPIIHRDLKPENLLLKTKDPNSELRVADFGLSLVVKNEIRRRKTICGTWAYSAPEVRRTRGNYDSKADLWSMGVITYVLLAAIHPFDPECGASDHVMYERACQDRFDFEDSAWDNVSSVCQDFVSKLIVSDPAARMSAREALGHPWLQNERPPTLRLTRSFRQRQALLEEAEKEKEKEKEDEDEEDEGEGVAASVSSRSVSEEDLKMSSMSINERLGVFRQCDYSSVDRWKKSGGRMLAVNRMLEGAIDSDLRGCQKEGARQDNKDGKADQVLVPGTVDVSGDEEATGGLAED